MNGEKRKNGSQKKNQKKKGKTVRHSPAVLPSFSVLFLWFQYFCFTVTWKNEKKKTEKPKKGKFIYIYITPSHDADKKS